MNTTVDLLGAAGVRAYRKVRRRANSRFTGVVVVADRGGLPTVLNPRRIYQLGERGKWAVLDCPCGRELELNLAHPGRAQWTLRADEAGRPSLFPSVDYHGGRRCHFWLRDGRVLWVSNWHTVKQPKGDK